MDTTSRSLRSTGSGSAKRTTVRAQTDSNRELLRRTTLEAAASLFMERGYAGTSMADVARALKVSRPTLYYYFENKEAILSALVQEVTVSASQAAERADTTGDPLQALYELARRQVTFIIKNATIFRVLTNSQVFLPESLREVNDSAKQTIFKSFERLIARGIQEGCMRDVNPAVAAFTVIGMCNWSSSWFKADKALNIEEVACQIAHMATASLAAQADAQRQERLSAALATAQASLTDMARILNSP